MALDKIVDSTQLNGDLTSVADAIRTKGGTSASLLFPSGFIDAIDAIPTGGGAGMVPPYAYASSTISQYSGDESGVLDYAFFSCWSLVTVSFPMASYIGDAAFYSCYYLETVSFPMVSYIAGSAFASCQSLTTANFPMASYIGDYAFYSCRHLETVSFPMVSYLGRSTFASCLYLTTANFPMASYIENTAFSGCIDLATVSFPMANYFGNSVFSRCHHLLSLYLLGSSVATLSNSGAFSSTPIAGYTTSTGGVYGSIFVRASLLSLWQAATNWTYFSSRFVGLTDEQIAALGG